MLSDTDLSLGNSLHTPRTNGDKPKVPGLALSPSPAYAENQQRFYAWLVDQVLSLAISLVPTYFLFVLVQIATQRAYKIPTFLPHHFLVFSILEWTIFIFGISTPWLYHAIQESGQHQATPGKRLIGLRVTDLSGNRISFARASARYFAKFPSFFLLLTGYLIQPFTARKQALHDILAGTLVVLNPRIVPPAEGQGCRA